MLNGDITNNHLKDVMEKLINYMENDEEPPLDLVFQFICELKVSRLFIPAIDEGDSFLFEHLESEDDDSIFLPLFTDIEEYNKHASGDADYQPTPLDFEQYADIMFENDFDAILINVEGRMIPLDQAFLKDITFDVELALDDDFELYDAKKLKEIFENVTNDSLCEFIRNEEINTDTEKLYVELSNSILLNIIVSETPLDEFADDGIIEADDVDGFSLCSIEEENLRFAAIFTDKDALEKAIDTDSDVYFYGQVTLLSALFDYVLRNDMDGVVINANTDDYLITRDEILSQASGIEIVIDNRSLGDCLDYSFIL